jgi:hypothetical protein
VLEDLSLIFDDRTMYNKMDGRLEGGDDEGIDLEYISLSR